MAHRHSKSRKYNIIATLLLVVVMILESIPYSVIIAVFGQVVAGDTNVTVDGGSYSYFNSAVKGEMNIGALLTVVSTCVLFILSVIHLIKRTKFVKRILPVLSGLAALASVVAIVTSPEGMLIVGACITLLLIIIFRLNLGSRISRK